MHHGNLHFHGCQGTGQRGVRIAIYQKRRRFFLHEQVFDAFHHARGLCTVVATAYTEVVVGCGNAQFLEKYFRHVGIVVLPRMHNNFGDLARKMLRNGAANGCCFDDLWSCPDNGYDFHGVSNKPSSAKLK